MLLMVKTKEQVFKDFAQSIPNAYKMIHWARAGKLEIYFDHIHCKQFCVNEVLDTMKQRAESQGFTLRIEG